MKNRYRFIGYATGLLSAISVVQPAVAIVDDGARTVHLRKDCTENGNTIPNCFTTTDQVTGWLRATSTANEVTVKIGPGTFGYFNGYGNGPGQTGMDNISLQGAGPEITAIDGMQFFSNKNLHVQDLTVNNSFPAPVYWHGTGNSRWSNVHLKGGLYGWTETCGGISDNSMRPVHYWYSSKIQSGGKGYVAPCSENWFYGTEIISQGGGFAGTLTTFDVADLSGATNIDGEVHVYGGSIRAVAVDDVTYSGGITAISVSGGGMFHVHGTGIDVIGNNVANDVSAIVVIGSGSVHANQSSYVLRNPSGGPVYRVWNAGGTIKAPYQWEDLSNSPLLTTLINNFDGADSFIEPGCSATGCGTPGVEPHMMVYSGNCTGAGGPWYDTATKACRN